MRILALALLLIAAPAAADDSDPAAPAATAASTVTAPRLFGHLPYGEADRTVLAAPPSLPRCQMAREAAEDLERLLAAARGDGIELDAVSCFRSIAHQRRIFCSGAEANCDAVAALRSRFVGPPGHSEHATGYAIDFTQRGGACRAVEQCFVTTTGGQWLIRRAAEFGFEMSFPAGNKQGVGWEPWHWRWVGRAGDTRPEAQRARSRFAAAHAAFPALPAVPRTAPAESNGVQAASLMATSAIRRP